MKALFVLFVVILCAPGFAQVNNPVTFEEIAVGGGYADADGGAEVDRFGTGRFARVVTADGFDSAVGGGTFALADDVYGSFGTEGDVKAGYAASTGLFSLTDSLGAVRTTWDPATGDVVTLGDVTGVDGTFSGALAAASASVAENLAVGGTISVSGSNNLFGTDDQIAGFVSLWGSAAGEGGRLTIWNSAVGDSNTERWIFKGLTNGDLSWTAVKAAGGSEDVFKIDQGTYNIAIYRNLAVLGGGVSAGVAGTARGVLEARHGAGSEAPAAVKLYSANGTPWFLFVEDDGTVRIHAALPAANTDGAAVGTQF